jgi:ABC-type sulfate transport system permease component
MFGHKRDEKEILIMITTRDAIAAWDFSRWFAVLSPLLGGLLGLLLAYLVLH